MKTYLCSKLEKSSLRELLRKKSPDFILGESNSCFLDVIDRYEDCPGALVDFCQSDWLNLCECYNYQLLKRWENNRDDIIEMFEEFKQAYGYSSTLEALDNCIVEDPEDMAIAIVNCAMTYAAQTLAGIVEECL